MLNPSKPPVTETVKVKEMAPPAWACAVSGPGAQPAQPAGDSRKSGCSRRLSHFGTVKGRIVTP